MPGVLPGDARAQGEAAVRNRRRRLQGGRLARPRAARLHRTGAALARTAELRWYSRDGKQLGTVGEPGAYTQARLSPDDKRVALVLADTRAAKSDIWTLDLASTGWIVAMGFLVTLACGLVGNYLILRRMALVGDAISHSVLPGLAIAFLVSGTRNSLAMMLGALIAIPLCIGTRETGCCRSC